MKIKILKDKIIYTIINNKNKKWNNLDQRDTLINKFLIHVKYNKLK